MLGSGRQGDRGARARYPARGPMGTSELEQSPSKPHVQGGIFCPNLLPVWNNVALCAEHQAAGSPSPGKGCRDLT